MNGTLSNQREAECLEVMSPIDLKSSSKKVCLVLFGSPRKNGNTQQLLQEFLKPISDQYIIYTLYAYDLSAMPCMDCKFCMSQDGCIYQDLEEFDQLLRSADLFIIASPVYNMSFPAPVKSILDRMQRYFSARFFLGKKPPIVKQKQGVLLLTCGSYSPIAVEFMEQQLMLVFTLINVILEKKFVWSNTDQNSALKIDDVYTISKHFI